MTTYRALPDQGMIKEKIIYDYETGSAVWRTTFRRTVAGKSVMKIRKNNVIVVLNNTHYVLSRIIWRYMTGEDPGDYIVDHINGDWKDNRWCNLRLANKSQNAANSRDRPMRDLPKGVTCYPSKKNCKGYVAKIRTKHLGVFPTIEAARQAYEKAAIESFGEFVCLDR